MQKAIAVTLLFVAAVLLLISFWRGNSRTKLVLKSAAYAIAVAGGIVLFV